LFLLCTTAIEMKQRSRTIFPTIEELERKASEAKVDNDVDRKYVDVETMERKADVDKLRRIGFWRSCLQKFSITASREFFPSLWKEEYKSLKTKKELISLIHDYLKKKGS
jgi:hypothetical protein